MKTTEIFALCLIATVVSLLGFVVENVWLSVTKGFIDNRNMSLPFLIGYGIAIVAIFLLFGRPDAVVFFGKKLPIKSRFIRRIVYFLIITVCICVGEIVLGTIVEHTCHIYWWDYTRLPMHITRYTTIPTSMGFSMLICIFMNYMFEPLMSFFLQLDYVTLAFSAIGFISLLTVDFIVNAVKVFKSKSMQPRWRIDTTHSIGYRMLHVNN